ncbi:MAG: ribbon-helix-helix protein, CopG family [Dehalococcoidia bacterium]
MTKVLISLDDALLARIDEAANREKMSRSGYISQLAVRQFQDKDEARLARGREALDKLAELGRKMPSRDCDVTEWIRMDRDSH